MATSYSGLLRKEAWRRFRKTIIERDGHACVRCGIGLNHVRDLQVHHRWYESGRLPWDYPPEACETICASCHAQEHGIIPPRDGWLFVADDDLGSLAGECEFCGTDIRYIFTVHHPRWYPLDVGTICCDRLTGTLLASEITRKREARERFVDSPRWHYRSGELLLTQHGISVAIVRRGRWARLRLNGHFGQRDWASVDEAKRGAFDLIESGDFVRWEADQTHGVRS